jgi:cell division protease FtsH
MVRDWGMSPRLGPVGLSNEGSNYLGLDNGAHRAHAEETQRVIDEEVSRLLRQAEQSATDLLSTHHQALYRLIDLLQEKETVNGSEIYAILNAYQAHPADQAGFFDDDDTRRLAELGATVEVGPK